MYKNRYGTLVPSVYLVYAGDKVIRVYAEERPANEFMWDLQLEDQDTFFDVKRESLF
jgi:hypothetical protein